MVNSIRRFFPPATAFLILAFLHLGGVFSQVQNSALDYLFRLRGDLTPTHPIIIIGVDEKSQEVLGPWPFPRDLHAALLTRLKKAKAVGFDFLFTAETPVDHLFSKAMQEGPPIVLAVTSGTVGNALHPSSALSGYSSVGHIETLRSGDGVVRSVRLRQESGEFSFALALFKEAGGEWLEEEREPRLINYYGPAKTFLTLSYIDVLFGRYDSGFFENSIVLVGADDIALGDAHSTPFSRFGTTPGVEIQASILHNLMADNFLNKSKAVFWAMVGLIFYMALFVWPMRSESFNSQLNFCVFGLFLLLVLILFRFNYVVDPISLFFFLGLSYFCHLLLLIALLANRLLTSFLFLEKKIASGLSRLFHNVPQYLGRQSRPDRTGFSSTILERFQQMESAEQTLELQYRFIENILAKEAPPLILWERVSESPILTNQSFDQLWLDSRETSQVPLLTDFFNLISRASDDCKQNDLQEMLLQNQELETVIHLPQPMGRKKYYRVTLRPFSLGNSKFSGLIGCLSDVTEIKEMERLKDEVVSIVSHELKLPLTTIGGYGEMLEDELTGKHKEYAKTICGQTRRLSALINDFLDINRLESGKTKLNLFPLDLLFICEEAVFAVTLAAEKKEINIEVQLPVKISPIVGDEQLLLQAIINVLENSIKYSPTKTTIKMFLQEQQKGFALRISDQGPGIPTSEQSTIFNKFVRGEKEGRQTGFGLGLSFVREVVTLHQGNISLVDTEKAGTTMEIFLPKREEVKREEA